MNMKKIFRIIATALLLCSVISMSVSAAELKTAPILAEEDRKEIVALEESILSDLYYSSLSEKTNTTDKRIQSIDFNKAQKVYVFSPDEFLELVAKNDFFEIYQREGRVVWKVPVQETAGYCDYAIIGKGEDGRYNYTTVSAPADNIDSVKYLFYPDEANNILKSKTSKTSNLAILSIPMYGIDLLMVETEGAVSFIPYCDQNNRIRTGVLYSTNELVVQIEEIVQENKTTEDAGGGMGTSTDTLSVGRSNDNEIRVSILGVATCAAIYLFLKQWKAYKRERK